MTIIPITSRASTHDAVTGVVSEQHHLTQWVPPAQSDGGGVPAPLSPEQVEAYLHDKARRTELAGYLADEMCALLDNEIIRPMTSNRRATVLAHMEALAANLAQAYRLPDDRRDKDDHTDSEFIEALVDRARFFGAESQPGRLS